MLRDVRRAAQTPPSARLQGIEGEQEEQGCSCIGMNEFHYSINISFVPASSPAWPRFVPGSHFLQTPMAAGFCQFVPVSPALLAVMGPKEVQSGPVRP